MNRSKKLGCFVYLTEFNDDNTKSRLIGRAKMKRLFMLSLFVLWAPVSTWGQSDDFPRIPATTDAVPILYSQDGTMSVDLVGILGDDTYLSQIAPKLALIKLTRQQALEIRDYLDSIKALGATARERSNATEFASKEEIDAAAAYVRHIQALCKDARLGGLKHKLNEVLDRQQLHMLKSLGIDIALKELGFEKIISDTILEMNESSGFQLDPEEAKKLLQAILETEWELRREMVHLRREAWDRLMKKLPDGVADQIEVRLGLDGIGK